MRCPRCGNDNPEGMRFCGMCGGTLLASPQPAGGNPGRGVSPATQPSAPPTATATRPAAPEERRTIDSSPAISGPSFLGLNDAPAPRKQSNLHLDTHGSGSRNVDYLLEDEEEHRGGGVGKFFVIVLALLLAVGFGYLRWKDQLPWLNAGTKKPAPTTQTTDQPAADTSTSTPPAITPEPQPAPSQGSTPASTAAPANQGATTAPSSTPASTPPAAASSQPPANSSPAKSDSSTPEENTTTSKSQPESAADSKSSETASNADDSASDDESSSAPASAATKSAPAPPTPKPKAASKPVDSLTEAQKYLYGRGAAQDCDRGLRLLKPIANQGNPKAMAEMGALYSAGLCTPRDLPTSYRWFAVALRKDPSNQALQNSLQKLWGEMTQPERQLAIKLTQ